MSAIGPISLSSQLQKRGDGKVSFVVLEGEGEREVEVALGNRLQISPQIAGAIKAIPGVVDVEMF